MFNSTAKRAFSIVSGVLFILLALYNLIITLTSPYLGALTISTLFYSSILIAFAIISFMQKKEIPAVIITGAYLFSLMFDVFTWGTLNIQTIIEILAVMLLIFIALMNCIQPLKQMNFQKFICFVPGALVGLRLLITLILGSFTGIILLLIFARGAAFLFTGFWLVDEVQNEIPSATQNQYAQNQASGFAQNQYNPYQAPNAAQNQYNPYQAPNTAQNQYNPYQSPAQNNSAQTSKEGAEKLEAYKKLLDQGLITPEEFEEKKRQIMNTYF